MSIGGFGPLLRIGDARLFIRSEPLQFQPRSIVDSSLGLRELAQRVLGLRQTLGELRSSRGLDGAGGPLGRSALAFSENALNLPQASSTTLRSSAEINTESTGFSPTQPAFAGNSTSKPTIGGTYDGSQGTDTLTFRALNPGSIGSATFDVQVRDGSGSVVEAFTVLDTDPAGTEYTLSNGLTVAFTEGSVSLNDSFDVDVFDNLDHTVNSNNPFDQTGSAGPNFASGVSVTAGSFEVNGATILVAANDSIQSVLAKISASSANVTATFDTASETVVLTHDTPGANSVAVGNDDSGFLSAVKLDDGLLNLGSEGSPSATIGSVAALAGISSGTLSINGTEIAVDVLADSLEDVVDRINAADAGVLARYDTARDAFVLLAKDSQTPLILSDGTSGFFSGVGIQTGIYKPTGSSSGGLGRNETGEISGLLGELGRSLGAFFRAPYGSAARVEAKVAQSLIEGALDKSFEALLDESGGSILRSGLGLDYFRGDGAPRLELDVHRFGLAASTEADELVRFLASDDKDAPGLLVSLAGAVDQIAERLLDRLTPEEALGLRLDVAA